MRWTGDTILLTGVEDESCQSVDLLRFEESFELKGEDEWIVEAKDGVGEWLLSTWEEARFDTLDWFIDMFALILVGVMNAEFWVLFIWNDSLKVFRVNDLDVDGFLCGKYVGIEAIMT